MWSAVVVVMLSWLGFAPAAQASGGLSGVYQAKKYAWCNEGGCAFFRIQVSKDSVQVWECNWAHEVESIEELVCEDEYKVSGVTRTSGGIDVKGSPTYGGSFGLKLVGDAHALKGHLIVGRDTHAIELFALPGTQPEAAAGSAIGTCDGADWYIPRTAASIKDASGVLRYSYPEGANRPMADIFFPDGYEVDLSEVCPGTYAWRISVEIRGGQHEACMKMGFSPDGRSVRLQIKSNEHTRGSSSPFAQHLRRIPQDFKKVPCIKSGI